MKVKHVQLKESTFIFATPLGIGVSLFLQSYLYLIKGNAVVGAHYVLCKCAMQKETLFLVLKIPGSITTPSHLHAYVKYTSVKEQP